MIKALVENAGYSSGASVLRGVDLEVREGETIAITGRSGSGKTTLLLTVTGVLKHLLNGFVNGKAWLKDLNVLDINDFYRVPSIVGVVLQDPEKQIAMPTPWDETVFTLENMGFSEEEVSRRAEDILRRYGLLGKAHRHVEELSGGEKRRLTIASAIVHEPEILFLDEPTASIDPWGIREIRNEVEEFRRRNYTLVLIEHKIKYFLDLVDRIYVLNDGRVVDVLDRDMIDDEDVLNKLLDMGIDSRRSIVVEEPRSIGEEIVKLRDLVIGYGDNALIKDVDLELHRGEVVAVIGPNGCGKTTLLKTIAGALKPLGGEIVSRGRVFYVPQQPDYLFLKRSLESELLELSRRTRVELGVFEELIPWFNSYRDIPPYRLSHGQRRWLSIIIAYAYSRDSILLDEPTTGLDYGLFRELKRLVNSLRERGVGFIIATHDPRVVGELADTVYIVEDQRLRLIDKDRAVDLLENVAGVAG